LARAQPFLAHGLKPHRELIQIWRLIRAAKAELLLQLHKLVHDHVWLGVAEGPQRLPVDDREARVERQPH
jgi:hypothetical protein